MAQQFATGPVLRASCQHAAEKARASCQLAAEKALGYNYYYYYFNVIYTF
jgi:hypothetical protein